MECEWIINLFAVITLLDEVFAGVEGVSGCFVGCLVRLGIIVWRL